MAWHADRRDAGLVTNQIVASRQSGPTISRELLGTVAVGVALANRHVRQALAGADVTGTADAAVVAKDTCAAFFGVGITNLVDAAGAVGATCGDGRLTGEGRRIAAWQVRFAVAIAHALNTGFSLYVADGQCRRLAVRPFGATASGWHRHAGVADAVEALATRWRAVFGQHAFHTTGIFTVGNTGETERTIN